MSLRTRLASLAALLPLFALVPVAGCGSAGSLECQPQCPTGYRCTEAGCVRDDGNPAIDMAAGGGDLSGCTAACGGATPYCGPDRVCVACLEDGHCPRGQICRAAGSARTCLPGCADDARCPDGQKCCNSTCVDPQKDSSNCGGCGTACKTANGTSSCVGGRCVAGTCSRGWGDCNMDGADGCETNLQADANNCMACGATCALKNAISGCAHGCYVAACVFGFDNCDADDKNGCETTVLADAKNCGACGNVCAAVPRAKNNCINGSCQITSCDVGFANCNGNLQDGCEIATNTDVRNCGACGNACQQGAVCIGGVCTCPPCNIPNAKSKCAGVQCVIDTCNQGWGDCDGLPQNGCERNIGTDANNCGACGKVCQQGLVCAQGGCTCPQCNIPNAKTACVNNVCVLDACLPGWSNCDNFAGNGCESDVSSDPKNCGGCGVVCPQNTPFCTGGMCNNVLASCLDIFNAGGKQSGQYTIDPDGAGPLPQVQVYCDMGNGGHTLYGVGHAWGEWGANMFIVMRDRLNPAVGSMQDWQASCQLFNKQPYVGSWKNNGGTYSDAKFVVYADAKDWWNNYALKVFPAANYDKFLILQDSQSTNCWAWYAEAGSLQCFGSPVGAGFAFCRNGNTAQQRYHIYLCL